MGAGLRAGVFEPDGRVQASLVAALARCRCTDVAIARRPADLAGMRDLTVVFVGGAPGERALACEHLNAAFPRDPREEGVRRPYVVSVVPDATSAVVDQALEDGADDVVASSQLGRVRILLRHADRAPRPPAPPPGAATALAQATDFILQVDAAGHITYMNRDSQASTVRETVGTRAIDHLPPDSAPAFLGALERAMATGESQAYDAVSHGAHYRVRVVPFSDARESRDGAPSGATLIATDVTEVLQARAKLAESRLEANAIVDALPDLVVRVSAEGRYLSVHAPRGAEPSVPVETLVGKHVHEVLPAEVAEQLMGGVRAALEARELQLVTYRLARRGATQDYEARIVPNGADQAVAVVRNMTEYNQSRERLALAERLASLGTMAAGVAHELNSPLTFVMLGLEWIERQLARPSELERDRLVARLQEVQDGARRIQRIVRDLKGFSRPEESKTSLVDVASAVDGALSLAAAELRYRTRVERDFAGVPAVLGNHARLGQVFLNLLVNAAHALPEERVDDNVIHIRTSLVDGRVAVEISDNGVGIPPEHLPRLFAPFFTTKPVGQGTGLGLWICHEIIAELDGEITVESTEGEGSTFRVLLPVATGAPSPVAPPAPAPQPPRARLLIIDDEPNLARTLARLLDAHAVEIATSGAEGLRMLEADAGYDLVLCDLMMPGLNGMDVHRAVHARKPAQAARFVFMSGGAFTPRAQAFLAEVGLPRLDKPFPARAVLELLKDTR